MITMAVSYNENKYKNFTGAGNFVDIKFLDKAPSGKYYITTLTFASTDTYATGGITLDLKRHGMKYITDVDIHSINADYGTEFDYTNNKLLLFTGLNTQVSNGTNISSLKITIGVLGRS